MQIEHFSREYQAKTNEELLRLALDAEQLTSEAKTYLLGELANRGINAEQIHAFQQEQELRRTGASEALESLAWPSAASGRDSYEIDPPSPLEATKPPWRPKTAGRVAFFFGPFAGALVVAISLRRMKYHDSAKRVMLLALAATAAEAAMLFFVPDMLSRLIGVGAEIAFLLIFPALMEKEFGEWQTTHPSALPSNGWKSIGWGFVGAAMFLVIVFLVFLVLAALVPAGPDTVTQTVFRP